MPRKNDFARAANHRRRAANRATVVNRRRTKHTLNRLKLNPTVAKLVDRRIDRKQETHQTYLHYRRAQWQNMPDTLLRAVPLFPPISQDTTRSTRLGSMLTLTSGVTKGMITIPADDNPPLVNGDRADIMLRLMCVSAKGGCNTNFLINQYLPALYPNWFKSGDSGTGFTGSNSDMWQSINHDILTVHSDKVYRMKRGVGYFPDPTSTSGAAHQPAINVPFRIRHKVKGKKVYYRGAGATGPENFYPFLVGVWSYSNGAAASPAAVPFVEHWTNWYYKA